MESQTFNPTQTLVTLKAQTETFQSITKLNGNTTIYVKRGNRNNPIFVQFQNRVLRFFEENKKWYFRPITFTGICISRTGLFMMGYTRLSSSGRLMSQIQPFQQKVLYTVTALGQQIQEVMYAKQDNEPLNELKKKLTEIGPLIEASKLAVAKIFDGRVYQGSVEYTVRLSKGWFEYSTQGHHAAKEADELFFEVQTRLKESNSTFNHMWQFWEESETRLQEGLEELNRRNGELQKIIEEQRLAQKEPVPAEVKDTRPSVPTLEEFRASYKTKLESGSAVDCTNQQLSALIDTATILREKQEEYSEAITKLEQLLGEFEQVGLNYDKLMEDPSFHRSVHTVIEKKKAPKFEPPLVPKVEDVKPEDTASSGGGSLLEQIKAQKKKRKEVDIDAVVKENKLKGKELAFDIEVNPFSPADLEGSLIFNGQEVLEAYFTQRGVLLRELFGTMISDEGSSLEKLQRNLDKLFPVAFDRLEIDSETGKEKSVKKVVTDCELILYLHVAIEELRLASENLNEKIEQAEKEKQSNPILSSKTRTNSVNRSESVEERIEKAEKHLDKLKLMVKGRNKQIVTYEEKVELLQHAYQEGFDGFQSERGEAIDESRAFFEKAAALFKLKQNVESCAKSIENKTKEIEETAKELAAFLDNPTLKVRATKDEFVELYYQVNKKIEDLKSGNVGQTKKVRSGSYSGTGKPNANNSSISTLKSNLKPIQTGSLAAKIHDEPEWVIKLKPTVTRVHVESKFKGIAASLTEIEKLEDCHSVLSKMLKRAESAMEITSKRVEELQNKQNNRLLLSPEEATELNGENEKATDLQGLCEKFRSYWKDESGLKGVTDSIAGEKIGNLALNYQCVIDNSEESRSEDMREVISEFEDLMFPYINHGVAQVQLSN